MEKEIKKEMDVKKIKAKAVQNKLIFMVQHLCYLPTGVNAPDEITLLQLHNTFIIIIIIINCNWVSTRWQYIY
jgi:hypothetical protein